MGTRTWAALGLGLVAASAAAWAQAGGAGGGALTPPGTSVQLDGGIEVSFTESGLSVYCVNADAHEVFARIGVAAGLRIMVNDTVDARITANLVDVGPREAIERIASAYGLSQAEIGGVIMVSEGVPNGPASYLASQIAAVRTQYVPADRVKSLMPTFLQYHIKTNTEQNAVVLSAPKDVIAKFKRDIAQFDIPAQEIMIEVYMVELTNAETKDLGVDLQYANGGTGLGANSSTGDLSFQGVTWLPTNFAATLTALATESRAKIRARPRIATVSGQEATIFIGIDRYLDKTVRKIGSSGGFEEQTSISAGVKLILRPFSGTGDVIIVNVDQAEISTLTASDPVTGLPNLTGRTAKTSVRVANGQTIVLGGLIQSELREREGGIPILRQIPVIGKFFQNRHKEETDTELVIFITPRKLSPTGHLPADEEQRIRDRIDVPMGSGAPASPPIAGQGS